MVIKVTTAAAALAALASRSLTYPRIARSMQERHLLHTHIIERMLTIARTTSGSRADLQRMHLPPASDDVPSAAADGSSAGDGAGSGEEVAGRSSPHPQKPNASAGPATSARPRVIPGGPPALRVPLDGVHRGLQSDARFSGEPLYSCGCGR